jgi:peptidyl-prolyl cis-trans isomerase A (cyclophilin A)
MKCPALFAAFALASAAAAQTPTPVPAPELVKVVLTTAQGPIVLELEKGRAPVTTGNFLRYVDQKRLDGQTFYRAATAPNAKDYGLIQFGTRNDPKRTLPPIAHEPTSKTGLSHKSGTISVARGDPGTAAGDFFIVVGDTPGLDAQPGDDPGFAAFGRVVEGMELVKSILAAPTHPDQGEGAMKGQFLAQPVTIITARRGN